MTDKLTLRTTIPLPSTTQGHLRLPHFPRRTRGVRAILSPSSTGYGLYDSNIKKTSRRKRGRKPPTPVCRPYQTMTHSLQSDLLHHQTSGDSGRSSFGTEVIGAALVSDSFRFLLYFPVRLYFPLVPGEARQKQVAEKGEQICLSCAWLVSCVGPVDLRNPCRWMNTIEAAGHATPSSVESGVLRGLCGGK